MDDNTALRDSLAAAEDRARTAEERALLLQTRLEVERCARREGIVDEDAAFRLLDTGRVELDGSGRPVNVEALIKELVTERPWLIGGPGGAPAPHETSASPANPPRDGTRRMTHDDLRRMTPEQINANWDAIQAALMERA